MAGDWIPATKNLTRKREVLAIAASARASELKRDGLVMPSGRRRETTTGSSAAVLVVT